MRPRHNALCGCDLPGPAAAENVARTPYKYIDKRSEVIATEKRKHSQPITQFHPKAFDPIACAQRHHADPNRNPCSRCGRPCTSWIGSPASQEPRHPSLQGACHAWQALAAPFAVLASKYTVHTGRHYLCEQWHCQPTAIRAEPCVSLQSSKHHRLSLSPAAG